MMKKWLVCMAAALCLMLAAAGCAKQAADGGETAGDAVLEDSAEVLYSNLADDASWKITDGILKEHGVSETQRRKLYDWKEDVNGRMTSPEAVEGFVPIPEGGIDYSTAVFELREKPDGSYYSEPNCRLSAFMVMKDFISTNGTRDEQDMGVIFDVEAIDFEDQFALDEKDRSNFITLYNQIPMEGTKTLEEHTALIEKAWQDRGIVTDDSTGISLVTLYTHSSFDDARFVGHVGVLFEQADGSLFLVEKYGPQAPFVALRFHNREEIKDYFMTRPDNTQQEDELPSIVMENGKPM